MRSRTYSIAFLQDFGELFSHPVVKGANVGWHPAPANSGITLCERLARSTPSLGCHWLFCANLNWLHRVKICNVLTQVWQAPWPGTGRSAAIHFLEQLQYIGL